MDLTQSLCDYVPAAHVPVFENAGLLLEVLKCALHCASSTQVQLVGAYSILLIQGLVIIDASRYGSQAADFGLLLGLKREPPEPRFC